jgi:hypothetical protein
MSKKKVKLLSIGIIFLSIVITGGVLMIVLGRGGGGTVWKYPLNPYNLLKGKSALAENLVTCKLCGELVDKKKANHYPVCVMIDNHLDARPAIGLQDACIVYETLVEGGITRLMPVFAERGIKKAGPVRSARPYYLDWVSEYNGLYVHAGGSPLALSLIYTYGILDMNHYSGSAFWRDLGGKYLAPHNLFVNPDQVRFDGEAKYHFDPTMKQRFRFRDDQPTTKNFVNQIGINYSNYLLCSARFDYNPQNNSYLRSLGGKADLDGKTKEQVEVKNLIVQISPAYLAEAGSARLAMQTLGEGVAFVFRDGKVIKANWRKNYRIEPTRYYNLAGKEIKMNRGLTWIAVVSNQSNLNYR